MNPATIYLLSTLFGIGGSFLKGATEPKHKTNEELYNLLGTGVSSGILDRLKSLQGLQLNTGAPDFSGFDPKLLSALNISPGTMQNIAQSSYQPILKGAWGTSVMSNPNWITDLQAALQGLMSKQGSTQKRAPLYTPTNPNPQTGGW